MSTKNEIEDSCLSKCQYPVTASMGQGMTDRLVVAAIDFGTTFSGFAFALKHDPDKIYVNQSWSSGHGQLISLKAPTCVLLTNDLAFDSFGYEAENRYVEISEDNLQEEWFFFKEFKMELYKSEKLTRKTEICEVGGKSASAMLVFSCAIKFLSEKLMQQLQKQLAEVELFHVKFILTIPAIWSDAAKQFMRESAIKAGIPNSQLILALEPEAAAIFCHNIPTYFIKTDNELTLSTHEGQYLVADLGGGTVDVQVHKTLDGGRLEEIHVASGGPWGGKTVNEEFLAALREFVGVSVYEEFKRTRVEDFMDVIRDLEGKKRHLDTSSSGTWNMRLPNSLKQMYMASDSSRELTDKRMAWVNDKLKIKKEDVNDFFKHSIESIIRHIKSILERPDMNKVDKILLVGGFSDCCLVQSAVRNAFPAKSIIVPEEAGLAVVKGAVMYGFNEGLIQSRVLRSTYGVRTTSFYDPESHPRKKLYYEKFTGEPCCADIFGVFASVGDVVKYNTPVTKRLYSLAKHKQVLEADFDIYRTQEKSPLFVDTCEKIGVVNIITVHYDTFKRRKDVDVTFIFGSTEIFVKAKDPVTNEEIQTELDLLSDDP